MADPAWFFSTLAQSVAAVIGFAVAVVMGVYGTGVRSFVNVTETVLEDSINKVKHLFLGGVVAPLLFLVTLPAVPGFLRQPYLLLVVQVGMLSFVGYIGWRLLEDFETLADAVLDAGRN